MDIFNEFNFPKKALVLIFTILTTWWCVLYFGLQNSEVHLNLIWGATYQLAAIWGVVWGLVVFRSWGGAQSLIGRAILMLSIGLLLQVFGQTVFSVYNLLLQIDVPYPSLADFGFFGSIPFYIYGTYLISKVCGAKISLKSGHNKFFAVLIPLVLLAGTYMFFLKDYAFDPSSPLRTFLDFGYPLGQAIYISFAILAFIFSKDYLGGIAKRTIKFVLIALCIQYAADFNFLLQAGNGTWVNGGYGDFFYLLSYAVMSFAIIRFGSLFTKIKNRE